jgi:hypothetical protein
VGVNVGSVGHQILDHRQDTFPHRAMNQPPIVGRERAG